MFYTIYVYYMYSLQLEHHKTSTKWNSIQCFSSILGMIKFLCNWFINIDYTNAILLLIFYYHVPQFNFAKRQKCLELKLDESFVYMWVYVLTVSTIAVAVVVVDIVIIIIIVCLFGCLLACCCCCCLKFNDLMWKIEIFELFPIAIVVRHDSSWKLKLIGFSCFFSLFLCEWFVCTRFMCVYVSFCCRQTIYFLNTCNIFFRIRFSCSVYSNNCSLNST